jgi:hypothetical protein
MLFNQVIEQILLGPIANNSPLNILVSFKELGYNFHHKIDPLSVKQPANRYQLPHI